MKEPNSKHVATALMWLGLTLLTYLLYLVIQPFLVPLGWACVLAVLAYPAHSRLARRIGPSRSAAATTTAIAVVALAPAVALSNAFAREMVDIARSLQSMFADGHTPWSQQLWENVIQRIPFASSVDLSDVTSEVLQRAATFLMSESGAILTNVAVFFVDLALALFATFFLLRDADTIMRTVRRLLPMSAEAREVFLTRTGDLIAAGVTSSAIVASLQGLLGGIAFWLVGISASVFWGVVMAFACLLPFGAWIIWLPAAIFLAATGAVTKALVLVGLGLGVVSLVDNVVRPMLLSGRVHMNGLVIFVSLLGGLNVFGLLGIVLGPIVVVTTMALVSSYVEATNTIELDDTPSP